MTSTAQRVWKIIEEDAIIRRALEKGIVSLKNLSTYIIKEHKIETTTDSVISAIRRYKEEQTLEKKYQHAREEIKKSKNIKITTNIVELSIEKNSQTEELLEKVFAQINYNKGEILLVIQGEQSIKIIIDEKNKEKILKIFPKNTILKANNDLAEINIHLSDDAGKTPGIISVLSTELMLHEINVEETMSCLPEMLFFVKQKGVVQAYKVLQNLCSNN
ncbi:MAG: hypothetical protein KKF89_04235 [Nanoarchaeota archaeon]|nr:hypothetical protein [Nanoarchaeota archaeon]MBU1854904.1 hypothetical protein [Nanoarchaeota archaeon]